MKIKLDCNSWRRQLLKLTSVMKSQSCEWTGENKILRKKMRDTYLIALAATSKTVVGTWKSWSGCITFYGQGTLAFIDAMPLPVYIIWYLTLVLLNPDIPCFANSVDPDQLASEEANWSGSALFAIKYANV